MGACGSLSTCNQSINFCTSRQRVCFTKCGNIRQTCGTADVDYLTATGTALLLNGFVEINNTGQCNMTVALLDPTGAALPNNGFTVLPGQTKMVGVTDLGYIRVSCASSTPTGLLCEGNWAFEGYYDI